MLTSEWKFKYSFRWYWCSRKKWQTRSIMAKLNYLS